jgi:hypothetical protein
MNKKVTYRRRMRQECSLVRSCSMQIHRQRDPEDRNNKLSSYTLVSVGDINNIRLLPHNQSRDIRHQKYRHAD